MDAERQQILEMLANGKITPEQAGQLLDAVEPDELAGADEWAAPRQELRQSRPRRRATPELRKLAAASMHGVTSQYIAEMRAAGYDDLTVEQLIELRIHGVNPDFVQEIREAGYTDLSPEDLVQLRISGVNADYLREMRGLVTQGSPSEEE